MVCPKCSDSNFYTFNTTYTLLTGLSLHNDKQRIFLTIVDRLGCSQPLQAFQELCSLVEFWCEDQGMAKKSQYHKIVYLLGPKGIEPWKSFTWKDSTDKEDPAKALERFKGSFHTPNTHWSYREMLITKSSRKTVEKLNIILTNILHQCSYLLAQMDNRKVETMFNDTKYFKSNAMWESYP